MRIFLRADYILYGIHSLAEGSAIGPPNSITSNALANFIGRDIAVVDGGVNHVALRVGLCDCSTGGGAKSTPPLLVRGSIALSKKFHIKEPLINKSAQVLLNQILVSSNLYAVGRVTVYRYCADLFRE